MTSFDPQEFNQLLDQFRDLVPTLRASMEMTFDNQAHYRWEGLDGTKQSTTQFCQVVTAQFGVMIRMMTERPGIMEKLPDRREFIKNTQILHRDLEEYSRRLTEIHIKHQGRTGAVVTRSDIATFINVWESYIEWAQSFSDVVLPLFSTIYEDLYQALNQTQTTH